MMKRKKILLIICFAALWMSSAPALADMYVLDAPAARLYRELSTDDAGNLGLVIDADGTTGSTISYTDGTIAFDVYGAVMQGAVGYVGQIAEDPGDGDVFASMWIGATGATLGIVGSYDGYSAWVSNDDDDAWSVRLIANVGTGDIYSNWATLNPGANTTLSMNFALTDFSTSLGGLGFQIQGTFDGASLSPSNPDFFHLSAVPTPTAVLLGILGLGAVGIKLRKYA